MKIAHYSRQLNIPEASDFPKDYAHFAVLVPKYLDLFIFLTDPSSVATILAATDMGINIPGIASIATTMKAKFRSNMTEPEWYQAKQFAGVVILLVHELNGYKKATRNGIATQRRVLVDDFSMGQVYIKI